MSDPTYPLFSVFAFLGFLLCLVPLPWHFYSGNSGTCYYIMWASIACLNQFVNSVIWAGNADNVAPIWCEICTCFKAFCTRPRMHLNKCLCHSHSNHAWGICWTASSFSLHKPPTILHRKCSDGFYSCVWGEVSDHTSQTLTNNRLQKRRAVIIDTLICVLFPLVFIAMRTSTSLIIPYSAE